MLPPEEFGVYYSVGYTKKKRGQAMFIELDPEFRHDFFRIEEAFARCVPHDDGTPKRSVYISTYRVLEHIPLTGVDTLYLVTKFGESLPLTRSNDYPSGQTGLYMYQEIAPVVNLVVSSLPPLKMHNFLTQDETSMIHLPAIAFVELSLGELARDPEHGAVGDLPYDGIFRLRECLVDLRSKRVHTKIVDRVHTVEYPYRMIKNGVCVGNTTELAYFPLPSRQDLHTKHIRWWNSANK
jgi:hypothetical protein